MSYAAVQPQRHISYAVETPTWSPIRVDPRGSAYIKYNILRAVFIAAWEIAFVSG